MFLAQMKRDIIELLNALLQECGPEVLEYSQDIENREKSARAIAHADPAKHWLENF